MTVVRMEHCRQLQYCSHGIRELFRRYGLDYGRFLREGIPAEELMRRTNNDAMAARAVEVARGR